MFKTLLIFQKSPGLKKKVLILSKTQRNVKRDSITYDPLPNWRIFNLNTELFVLRKRTAIVIKLIVYRFIYDFYGLVVYHNRL